MNIHACTVEDAPDVATVLVKSGLASDVTTARELFKTELERGDHYFLAKRDEPVGIVTWRQQGEIRHGLAELYHIGVIPDEQGTGVATALFEHLQEHIKEYYRERDGALRKLYLLTHEDNERAQGFYEKIGMEHEATLTDHFHDDLDEYVYSRFYR